MLNRANLGLSLVPARKKTGARQKGGVFSEFGDLKANAPKSKKYFTEKRNAGAERVRGACGWHRANIAARPETSMTASARRRETLSGPNLHGRTSAGCTGSQSCLVRARRVVPPTRVGGTTPPERPAGDPTHAMEQLDESAIAGNVGRDLAFAASRLAARSHPGVGGCAAPSSLVIFGISQPNARWTAGCSSPSGQRCSLHARTRHERAHICRGDDGRGTSRSRATACSRRAATAWQKDGFVAGTRAPRSGLPRVSVRVLASMRTGSPSRRCSCMRSMRATQPVRHRPVIAHAPCVGALREPTERPVHFVPANVILFLYQGKDFPGNTFDDEVARTVRRPDLC